MLARYPNFARREVEVKARELNRERLGGQRVSAEVYWEDISMFTSSRPHNSRRLGGIRITNLSDITTIEMVRDFAGTQSVEILEDNMSYTSDEVFTTLDERMRNLENSTLRTFTLVNSRRRDIVTAEAVFSTYEGATSAYDDLVQLRNVREYLRFPSLLMTLSLPYRFTISLDEKQYDAQRTQWRELSERNDREATIQIKRGTSPRANRVIVSLTGQSQEAVGALKVRIERLASGHKLDAAHWHPAFKLDKGRDFLDSLYEITGAYVSSDWKRKCVVVFGRPEAVEDARSRIEAEIKCLSSDRWMIPIQRNTLGFFREKGLAQIRTLLEEGDVALDPTSPAIVLQRVDLEEARHLLKQLIRSSPDFDFKPSTTPTNDPCPICYDSATQPFEIRCGHFYCSSCLRRYILSALDNNATSFPLRCVGSSGSCNEPLSIPLIKGFLSPQRFEQLITIAFTSYINKNLDIFRYCTTPDCPQIYRVTGRPHKLQCPSCFYEVCTACHGVGHDGTCPRRPRNQDTEGQERLLEAWADRNNAKQCPSCRTWVQKIGGCNHMTCKCGTDFCWLCSSIFDPQLIHTCTVEAHQDWYDFRENGHRRGTAVGARRERIADHIDRYNRDGEILEYTWDDLMRATGRGVRQSPANRYPDSWNVDVDDNVQWPEPTPRPLVPPRDLYQYEGRLRYRRIERHWNEAEENARPDWVPEVEEQGRLFEGGWEDYESLHEMGTDARWHDAVKDKERCVIM